MLAPENPLSNSSLPGMGNMPSVISGKSHYHDLREEKKINRKWIKHIFDG